MRTLACVVLLLATAASAEPKRKAAPDKLEKAAGEAFAKAMDAQDRGKADEAARHYQTSLTLAAHPNTAFNLAELYVAKKKLRDAIVHYELYLALSPEAADRTAVRALIGELTARRGTLWIHEPAKEASVLDLGAAYVIVNGEIVSRPGTLKGSAKQQGVKHPVLRGYYHVDVISPVTYDDVDFRLDYGEDRELETSARKPLVGNIFGRVSDADDIDLTLNGVGLDRSSTRIQVKPGKHWIKVHDRGFECTPIEIDAPKGENVLYIRVVPTEILDAPREGPERCRKLSIVKHVLKF